jgi:xylulokinase
MGKRCVLGIDIGTSSCKVCAVDAEGRLLRVEAAPYPILSPRPGWSEQDARAWLPAMENALAALVDTLPGLRTDVRALSFSSAAHIAVLLDADDEPVRNAILWNDQRAGAESTRLADELGDLILADTCNQASPTWTLPQLLWVQRHEPDVWRRVRRICLSKDFGIHRLTGRFCTDPATAVSSLLYNVRAGRWSEKLLERLGIGAEILPEVVPVTETVGTLLPGMADRLGLPRALPVIAGTLDSVAETYCTGATKPGDCVIRLGTGGGVQLLRPGPVGHPKLISYPYPVDPLWLSQAGTNACGASIDWAGRTLGGAAGASPEELSRLAAAAPPGSGGVIFHPYLLGERCPHWDGALRGSFVGLSLSHGPEHLARAVLEGIAYSLKDASTLFQEGESRCEPGTMTMVGGGVQSAVLTQIVCDVFGRQVRVNPVADSAYGAALLGHHALGASPARPSATPAESCSAPLLTPDRETSAQYAEGFIAYRAITDRLRGYYHSAAGHGTR